MRAFKLMDNVVDTRNPATVGRFQGYCECLGKPGVVVKFPGKNPYPLPEAMVKKTERPYRNEKRTAQPKPDTVKVMCERLMALKGWTEQECHERAAACGLTVKQVLQALTE